MKWIYIFVTLIVAISALPNPPMKRHEGHNHQVSQNANNNAAQPAASATPSNGQGRGRNRGGGRGGQNTQPSAQPANPAQPKQQPAPSAQPAANGANNPKNGQNANAGGVNPSLVPDFGQQAGLRPDGTGNCQTDQGKLIPCQCPPSRGAFISKLNQFVNAGSFPGGIPAPFPSGNSNGDAITRLNTLISALQNFNGKPGSGCPAIAAPNFTAQRARLQAA